MPEQSPKHHLIKGPALVEDFIPINLSTLDKQATFTLYAKGSHGQSGYVGKNGVVGKAISGDIGGKGEDGGNAGEVVLFLQKNDSPKLSENQTIFLHYKIVHPAFPLIDEKKETSISPQTVIEIAANGGDGGNGANSHYVKGKNTLRPPGNGGFGGGGGNGGEWRYC